jgi:hypothetical protein
MKKVIFLCLILSFTIGSCSKQENKFLLGAWQMVQMQRIDKGKVTNYFSDRYSIYQIKMWSEKHFTFVGKYKVDTTITYRFGTGTYVLDGNRYEEDILYHFDASYEGQRNKMLLEFRNDTLRHIFPVDDKGQPDERTYYIEKYVRLK